MMAWWVTLIWIPSCSKLRICLNAFQCARSANCLNGEKPIWTRVNRLMRCGPLRQSQFHLFEYNFFLFLFLKLFNFIIKLSDNTESISGAKKHRCKNVQTADRQPFHCVHRSGSISISISRHALHSYDLIRTEQQKFEFKNYRTFET